MKRLYPTQIPAGPFLPLPEHLQDNHLLARQLRPPAVEAYATPPDGGQVPSDPF